jgi:hypothetical protein
MIREERIIILVGGSGIDATYPIFEKKYQYEILLNSA